MEPVGVKSPRLKEIRLKDTFAFTPYPTAEDNDNSIREAARQRSFQTLIQPDPKECPREMPVDKERRARPLSACSSLSSRPSNKRVVKGYALPPTLP